MYWIPASSIAVLGADDRAWGSGRPWPGGLPRPWSPSTCGLGGVDVGPALAGPVWIIACSSTGGMYGGRVNSPSGSAAPADLGDADLVAEVGQGGDVVLLGRLDQLAGRPALDPRQDDVGGGDLVGLEPPLAGSAGAGR